ncbi:5'-nucleotidase SurE [Candidatus Syntrophocurvum alkaliphilum]|uniref:5'-nucleotidase SurE n=1 Tax=Candidatus Syntrophocurvum alkaliphilum TaxID=2293317 RepID=A0A6I6DA49_9FIRM|nr:5'/3'-nucleotidase SurE [Candidatus Syntrophocurvum alkaliphilum]QGT99279.1 5'-nucleotidase SurE [Candidatus Syntrophocurvum alkaliphilum]
MKILVTNDDGIHARGIHALTKELSNIAELYLVSPDRERSGTGHSITVYDPIKAVNIDLPEVKKGWVIGGTPVDCVKLALCRLIEDDIDLVVSGINHGANLGTDVLYSGTVSAAAEGVVMGVPSIAVSLDSFEPEKDFSIAAKIVKNLIQKVFYNKLEKTNLLNINVPAISSEEIKGVHITKLGVRNYDNLFEEREDPRGNKYYWLGGGVKKEDQEKDSDVHAVQKGYVSITPINLDLTDYNLINQFKDNYTDLINKLGFEEN